jgi:hypothetical protein
MAASRSECLRIVVTGLIAQYPLGGVTWDYVQYVAGLARLGHDVFYLEDTGQWPYDPTTNGVSEGCDFSVRYLGSIMNRFDLGDRWAYRFPWQSQWFGMSDRRRADALRSADLLINVSGTLRDPSEYFGGPRLVYVDSDPVFTQVKLARGQVDFRRLVDLHDVHFSFGEDLPGDTPETGHRWRPTRQPILIREWDASAPPRDVFTTIMNWTSFKPLAHGGRSFGQKDVELRRFIDLPAKARPTRLEIAINEGKTKRTPHDLLGHRGWQVVDPSAVCPDFDSYRDYIRTSKAEWSVAKNGYVDGRAGWFSGRSACYLAAGRPVVVQDTGFDAVLPVGEGILAFRTEDEAVAGIRDVEARYETHSRAARAIAEEYFDSDRVLARLLDG